ncbi:GRM4 [Cordylochernes scorpioides]|uniref:GRM4 n=1 Tax=Cordylochernes scorpioides TaxID=51811 RepID=A0ABY6KQD3_9ARAC|nr:GRM4 [Cordylochernes scorpioides]
MYRLTLDHSRLRWGAEEDVLPSSVCSEPCPSGYTRQFQGVSCCWLCVACRDDEYLYNDTCSPCPLGHQPLKNKTRCSKFPVEYMKWDSPWAIVPASFASLGIVSAVFVLVVFLRFAGTPVIMASGRELCYVLLVGILLCYAMSFVILAKPSTATCALMRIGLGLCLSICYSAIFTKTNRISRIFNRDRFSIKRPNYTSPRSQVIISLALVSVQLVFAVILLAVEPPSIKEVYMPRSVVLQCGISSISLVISLIYNMILIALCTAYAFKTRKIPENFNEAKYIGFTMYSTCIVWLAFIPIYFGTKNDFRIQIACLCMCISISATVALGCFFTPKVYIVLCQPYKNVRNPQGTQSSTSGGLRFYRPAATTQAIATVATAAVIGSARADPDFTTNGEITSPSVDESSLS